MKWIFSALILSVSLMGTSAQAYEGLFVPDENGQMKFEPLGRNHHVKQCWDEPDEEVVPASYSSNDRTRNDDRYGRNRSGTSWAWCDPGNRECPRDLIKSRRYCWRGWSQGWERCGYRCRPIERCGPQNGCSYPDHSRRF